jgi:ABC-type uncharacterized transport system ATPase subunit
MKIERAESKFEPVVITLESQEEVDILKDLTGRIINGGVGRNFTSTVYEKLDELSNVETDTYFKGTISTNTKI